MPNVPPQPKIDQIVWFENHYPLWETTPTAFGATAAMVGAVKTATITARQKYDAVAAAKQAWRNAVVEQNEAVRGMLDVGRDTVNIMKSFIENSGNTALWGQAGLEPDEPRGTAPDPTAPFELSAGLDSEGNVIVRWKTSQPRGLSGVIYSVRRSLDGGPFTLLDSVGEKEFVDGGIFVGTQMASYTVQAKRGRQVSPLSSALNIRFGHAGGGGGGGMGGMFIAATSSGPAKMAA